MCVTLCCEFDYKSAAATAAAHIRVTCGFETRRQPSSPPAMPGEAPSQRERSPFRIQPWSTAKCGARIHRSRTDLSLSLGRRNY